MSAMEIDTTELLMGLAQGNPYPVYSQLRAEQPIARVAGRRLFLVSRYTDLVAILKDPQRFSSRVPGFLRLNDAGQLVWVDAPAGESAGQILGAEDPPRHTRQRKFLSTTFHQRVKAIEPALQRYCEQLISELPEYTESYDFMAHVARRVPVWAIAELLGLPQNELPRLAQLASSAIKLMLGTTSDQDYSDCMQSAVELQHYLYKFYQRQQQQDDFSDNLTGDILAGVQRGACDETTALGIFYQLVVGAADTTTSWIGNTMWVALQNKDRLDFSNNAQIGTLMEEVIRLETPSQGNFRRVTEACELHGVELPKDALVLLLWGSANRDEDIYSQPDALLFTRDERQHLAFGRGIHACLGSALARMECRAIFEALWPLMAGIRAAENIDQPHWSASLFNRQLERLLIRIEVQQNSL